MTPGPAGQKHRCPRRGRTHCRDRQWVSPFRRHLGFVPLLLVFCNNTSPSDRWWSEAEVDFKIRQVHDQ